MSQTKQPNELMIQNKCSEYVKYLKSVFVTIAAIADRACPLYNEKSPPTMI